jgi:U32 family peptidase
MKKPELLMPAGNLEKMKLAFKYGADAVYAGVPLFSLRARENQFKIDTVKEAVNYAHKLNKKIYLTINIFPHNIKLEPLKNALKEMAKLKPNAFIMADPGVIYLSKEICPEIPIHLSVQANNVNWAEVKFWYEQGIERVILSREISIKEIKEIHDKVPNVELEFFVHGAICMAYSGRCLLSNYLTYRDANQGTCAHSCRWQYKVYKNNNQFPISNNQINSNDQCPNEEKENNIVEAGESEITSDGVFDPNYKEVEGKYFLEELKRPNELMEIDEDEYGTYIMNSRDLCAIEYLKDLHDAGICSFKVEGRSKSIYYVATVSRTYRKAIDDMFVDKKSNFDYVEELSKTANRGFIPGFLINNPKEKAQYYEKNVPLQTHKFLGIIRDVRDDGFAEVNIRNHIKVGTEIEIISPNFEDDFKQILQDIRSLKGEKLEVAHGGDKNLLFKFDREVKKDMIIRFKLDF